MKQELGDGKNPATGPRTMAGKSPPLSTTNRSRKYLALTGVRRRRSFASLAPPEFIR
jgi:hypothetical protein